MFSPRVIVVLLVAERGLVKSVQFRDHIYVGDPVNAVRIFSSLSVDEIMLLDIDASRLGRKMLPTLVADAANEAAVPLSIGGGIRKLDDISDVISAGAEKVVIGSKALETPQFVKEAAEIHGSSAISVCIDVQALKTGKYEVRTRNGGRPSGVDPVEFAAVMESMGAGELVIQAIARDGLMCGYDLELISRVASRVSIPVIALGGAAGAEDFSRVITEAGASAAAAGSAFVFFQQRGSVLLNYPHRERRR